MNEVDEDAWAAVRRVLDWKRPTLTASEANDLTTVLSLLPEALTNPQPALPTVPGVYVDAHGGVVIRSTTRWRYDGAYVEPESLTLPLTRLVPERPQVTREQIADHLAACSELPRLSNMDMADSLLDLVYGTPA